MWSKSQIRSARKTRLQPLLIAQGRSLKELDCGNWAVESYHDLIVKDNYWLRKSTNQNGNTIDYFMTIEGMSFNQAMQVIMAKQS